MEDHVLSVGLDFKQFQHNIKDQNSAFQQLTQLALHVPNQIPHDVRTKFSIRHATWSNPLKGRAKTVTAAGKYSRCTRIYQCSCGMDTSADNREIPWDNVDCLAWVQLIATYDISDDENPRLLTIDKISGIFDHCVQCQELIKMSCNPRIPLHPDMREYALTYAKWGLAPGNNHYRYMLSDHESSLMYQTLANEIGIPQCSVAEDNLDCWFCPMKPEPSSPLLSEALVFYQPHITDITDRFALILMSAKQQEMAWSFDHRKQMLMDGTFNVCSSRVLLFILMVIDNKNHGIPVCQIIFSAQQEKASMGKNKDGEEFNMTVANTDNDVHERHALQINFPDVLLLLYNEELTYFKQISKARVPLVKAKGKAGLAFLAYFQDYLKTQSFRTLWSPGGVLLAAERMGVPLEKHKYFALYYHSGRLPRINVWVYTLVVRVLPAFFV
ncbi:hypothetical protein EDB19DRAFT_1897860 [Suillus lakei]|nr:hypothetical protein EDB19DRAFT_1897860 [Suillus lakei]